MNRFDTQHTHGAGCVLSAAITGLIALGNDNLLDVIHQAIEMVLFGIYNAQTIAKGHCPVETRILRRKGIIT